MTDLPNIPQLQDDCTAAQMAYKQGNPTLDDPCFALIEQAFRTGDERAWQAIYTIFTPQMRRWIQKMNPPPDAVDDLIQDAFLSLIRALPKRLSQEAVRFETTADYLGYFKRCAWATVIDYQRAEKRRPPTVANEDNEMTEYGPVEQDMETNILQGRFLQRILAELVAVLNEEQAIEHLVAEASWVYGLKPDEIATRYADQIKGISEVRKIKRNLLDRLKRRLHKQLEALCQTEAEQIVFTESWQGRKRTPAEIWAAYPDHFNNEREVEIVKQRLLERLEERL